MKHTPIRRQTPLARGGRLTPKKRSTSEFARIYGSRARVAWVKAHPSVASGLRPCENVHVRTGGVGRKADACWIVPLTAAEHRELHSIGQASFEAKYKRDLDADARYIEWAWQAFQQRGRET